MDKGFPAFAPAQAGHSSEKAEASKDSGDGEEKRVMVIGKTRKTKSNQN